MVLRHLALAIAAGWVGHAAAEPPKFEAYPAHVMPGTHEPHLDLSEPKSQQYADALESAAGQPVNFAGHYILTVWGCGASCVMGAAIDADTGTVAWLPFTVCCWSRDVTEPLDFKPDSRLLVIHGSLNEQGEGTHEFLFNGHTFTPGQGTPRAAGMSPAH